MTYDKYFRLDSDQISQHCDLEKNDKCLYLGEYLSNSGFRGSNTNKDILNLKKSPLDKTKRGYEYKAKAINKFASQINSIFEQKKTVANDYTWIPIPPSKTKDHEEYDDRLLLLLNQVPVLEKQNIIELLYTATSHVAVHKTLGSRPDIETLKQHFAVDSNLLPYCKNKIILVDDVLTNGTHFKACSQLIMECIPDVEIIGFFLARRVIHNDSLEDFSSPIS
jgi:predicted amidophosphoribosyltransferase